MLSKISWCMSILYVIKYYAFYQREQSVLFLCTIYLFLRKLVIQLQSLQHLVAIFQVWLNNTLHYYPIFHRYIKKLSGFILSTVFLDCVYLTYNLIFAVYLIVLIRLRLYFQSGYSIYHRLTRLHLSVYGSLLQGWCFHQM